MICINKYLLEKIGLTDCDFNELFNDKYIKKYILSIFNGFNYDKDNEFYVSNCTELNNYFKKYNLDLKNIYIDEVLFNKGFLNRNELVYIYKDFIIEIRLSNNINELLKSLNNSCRIVDSLLNKDSETDKYIFYLVPQRFVITMFNLFASYLDEEDLIEIGKSLYKSSDYGANNIKKELVEKIFKDTLTDLKDLYDKDGYITVYRGVGSLSKSIYDSYAWTLDINTAKFFATRCSALEDDISNIKVYKAKILKDYILGYIDDEEDEVIVNPDCFLNSLNKISEIDFDKTINYQMIRKDKKINKEKEKANKFMANEIEKEIVIDEKLLNLFK